MLPTYNEADNIVEVLRRLRMAVPAADILVVDDASPDGTAEIARASAAELGGVDVLVRAGKLGLGSAYRDGFIEGLRRGYQVLVEMDGDLSHDPAALPALLRAVEGGADLAVGSRYIPGGSIPHWSRLPSGPVSVGQPLRPLGPGFAPSRCDLGVPCLPGRHRHPARSPLRTIRRLRLPDRDGVSGGPRGWRHRRSTHRVRRP